MLSDLPYSCNKVLHVLDPVFWYDTCCCFRCDFISTKKTKNIDQPTQVKDSTGAMKSKFDQGMVDSVNTWSSELSRKSNHSGGNLPEGVNFYFIYIQPFILLLFVVWQIVLIHLLRGKNFWSRYGLLFACTIVDIVGLLVQESCFVVFILIFPSALPGRLCVPYDVFSTGIPLFMSTLSQWLKIGYIAFVFLLIQKPFTVKIIASRRNIGIFVLVSVFVSLFVTIPMTYSESKHKFFTITRNNVTTHYCHHKNFVKRPFLPEGQGSLTHAFLLVSQCLRWLVPLPLLLIFTVKISMAISKIVQVRQTMTADLTKAMETKKIAKVTVIVAIFYTIVTLVAIPSSSWDILRRLSFEDEGFRVFTGIMSILSTVLYICNIPFTFFMFTLLSPRFKTLYRFLCRG